MPCWTGSFTRVLRISLSGYSAPRCCWAFWSAEAGYEEIAWDLGSPVRTLVWLPIGIALGLALYVGQGAPTAHPTVILNAYAQVLVVSMAEVLVCWAVVAGTLCQSTGLGGQAGDTTRGHCRECSVRPLSLRTQPTVQHGCDGRFPCGHRIADERFFFFLSRDVYATIAFHNFLGVFGVLQALIAQEKAGRL
ncbi:hypothetical protein QW131_29400 [Roseibium salinum]|nr:hypothetical protein [Roseibium salinum]